MSSYPAAHHRRDFERAEAGRSDAAARVEARMGLLYAECELGPVDAAQAAGLALADSRAATDVFQVSGLSTCALVEAARLATAAWSCALPPAPLPPRGRPVLRVVGGTAAQSKANSVCENNFRRMFTCR